MTKLTDFDIINNLACHCEPRRGEAISYKIVIARSVATRQPYNLLDEIASLRSQ